MITEDKDTLSGGAGRNGNGTTALLDATGQPITHDVPIGFHRQKSRKYAPPLSNEPIADDNAHETKNSDAKADKPKEEKPKASPLKRLLISAMIAAALIIAVIYGISYYHYSNSHVSTDDAYTSGDMVNVSPIISGTLNKLMVQEGDRVVKGQLIARLEDSGTLATLGQEQAAYNASLTEIPQARISLVYQEQSTDAAIRNAQAAIDSQNAKTAGAVQQVTLSASTLLDQTTQAERQVAQAQSQSAQADAQVAQAQATVQSQKQAVQTVQRAADTDSAKIASAEANQLKATRDEARYAVLVKQEAVTEQTYDSKEATLISAQSDLQSAREQAAESQSRVAGAQADVQQAIAQLSAARHNADAMDRQVEVYRAALRYAQSNLKQVGIKQTDVANNLNMGGQAQASLATALAGRKQIALKESQIATYEAQAAQAKAALASAQVTQSDTFIYSPTDGQVVRKAVGVGAALSAGQTIVTITQANGVWVTANFKETQLTHVRPGQSAEVEVDTFPGKKFHGRVQSIEEATGSSTALLPPDNATGNFTKVVQRVPVRIQLIPAAQDDDKKYARAADIANLRQGLSVTATIDTGSNGQ